MPTPRFIAKKVGDAYVLERSDPIATAEGTLWSAVGGVLTLAGFARGGPLGWLAMFGGLSMICRGVTGKNPFASMAGCCQEELSPEESGPSHQNDARPTSQTPQDATEEASMQSFPGSDPPARTGVASVG